MRLILLGGAPGVGKSAVARALLAEARQGSRLVQWVDVDALWLHQPWQVTDVTTGMLRANLTAVLANAADAGVDDVVVTWVFQDSSFHALVAGLAPASAEVVSIQLTIAERAWRERLEQDPERPSVDEFYLERYRQAQETASEHRLEVTARPPAEIAAEIARRLWSDYPAIAAEASSARRWSPDS